MIYVVSGSRDFPDLGMVKDYIKDHVKPGDTLIHGGARGVDRKAAAVASEWGAYIVTVPADWDRHGKSAGVIRNTQMIESALEHQSRGCEVCGLVFWDGVSRGTKHFIDTAEKLGLRHYVFKPMEEL